MRKDILLPTISNTWNTFVYQ